MMRLIYLVYRRIMLTGEVRILLRIESFFQTLGRLFMILFVALFYLNTLSINTR